MDLGQTDKGIHRNLNKNILEVILDDLIVLFIEG